MPKRSQSMCIARVFAREVFDSRGRPTVEAEVTCGGGHLGRAIAPSGASKGRFEALELRDGDPARLGGMGVLKAVANVSTRIESALRGLDAADQTQIDARLVELDGTTNLAGLGANATVAVSLAVAHAAAAARGLSLVEHLHEVWQRVKSAPSPSTVGDPPRAGGQSSVPAAQGACRNASSRSELGTSLLLPLPMVNMISGGLHAGRNLDFQDFLILPVGANSFRQAFEWVVAVYSRLGELLREAGYEGTLVGDEGGYGPRLASNQAAVEMLVRAIETAGLAPGSDVAIGLDVAATHLSSPGGYRLPADDPARTLSSAQMVDLFADWVRRFPIVSIEDPLDEEDVLGWQAATAWLGERVQLIGDDLFVTSPGRFRQLAPKGLANSVLIKVNQNGTLSGTLETMRLALDAGYLPVISARSGETEDCTIADLAVATGAGQIKIGSVARSERLAKYNQLLRLEETLGDRARYLGGGIFEGFQR
jgi:enolase